MDIYVIRLASILTIRQIDRKADAYARRPEGLSRDVAADVHKLVRAAKSLARLAVRECNGPGLTNAQTTRQERLETLCKAIAADYGLTCEVSGDPRGYVVKLVGLPVSNELGGAWGVA